MIRNKTKRKLLNEIQKFGNVYLSCLKIGISRATYYRWKQEDEKFKKEAEEAERVGRENICDVAEHSLLQNIKNKDQRAIEFTLTHNSEKYKRNQTTNVVIVHKKEDSTISSVNNDKQTRLVDLVRAVHAARNEQEQNLKNNQRINIIIDNEDSISETDKPPIANQENQKI